MAVAEGIERQIGIAVPTLGDGVSCWTEEEGRPPLFIEAKGGAFAALDDVTDWVAAHRAELDALILRHGGIVLRGFPIAASEDFGAVTACFPAYTGGYQGGAAARRSVAKGVYEATQRTGDQAIPIHQEMFYLRDYPSRIAFFAKKVAEVGGGNADRRHAQDHQRNARIHSRQAGDTGDRKCPQLRGQIRQHAGNPANGQARVGLRLLHRF